MASAARTNEAGAAQDEAASIAQRTGVLIGAIRVGNADEVYRLADEAAEQSLDAGQMFAFATAFARKRGDRTEAIRFAALDHHARPADSVALTLLVDLLVEYGAHGAAGAVLDRAIGRRPRDAELGRRRVEVALADPAQAADHVEAVVAGPAGDRPSTVERFLQELIKHRAFAAAEHGLALAEQRHGPASGWRRLAAQLAQRSGALEEADRRWRALGEEDPAMLRAATLFRARIAIERGSADEAERLYGFALKAEPANAEAARYVVRARVRRGRLEEAAEALEVYRAAAGETATAAWLGAVLLVARGEGEAASHTGDAALLRFPDDPELALRIADLHSDAGDWARAAGLLDAALGRMPSDFGLLARRVRAAEARGEPPREILGVVERARALRPLDQGMMRTEANLLARVGERRRAVAVALSGVQHHPRAPGFWRVAIANLLNLNEPEKVGGLVERARATFERDEVEDLLPLSEILETAELLDDAAAIASRAVSLDPERMPAQLSLARLRMAAGDYRGAMEPLLALRAAGQRAPAGDSLFARASCAIAYVDARPSADGSGLRFPDAVVARIAAGAQARPVEETAPLVMHVTGSLGAGGAERQVALTVRGQQTRDAGLAPLLAVYDATVGSGRDFFLASVSEAEVEIVELSGQRAGGAVRDFVAARNEHRQAVALLGTLPAEAAAVALPLYGLLVARRPRVIHLWQDATSVAGGIAALLAGVPRIVLGTRSTRPVERQRVRPWLEGGYRALLSYPGTTMLNNSANGARDYEGWLDLPPGTVQIVHNGFDFAAMRARADPDIAQTIRAELGLAPGAVLFGGVMRLSFEKRPELWVAVAIALARRVPNFHAVLVGEGPMREPLLATIDEAGLTERIVLVGRQAPVEPWMSAMDLLFLSSLTEGLPNVLIEAQALGRPVATMRVGGAPETVIEGRTAIVADEGTPEEIAERLLPLVIDGDLRAAFGRAASAWAEASFSDHAMLDRLDMLYGAVR